MTYPDYNRDSNLTDFGKTMLADRYAMKGEGPQDIFYRTAKAYSDDERHGERIYDYMSNFWFMPATPILSNGGVNRGLPISCFVNETQDDLKNIAKLWNENIWLASKGGGIGSYWGNVRSIGEPISKSGKTSGVIPFIKVMDSMTTCISQGSLRRGSSAVYLDINHPEIEEFIDLRRPTGDPNRRSLNINHGVIITDDFMNAVKMNDDINLISPATKKIISSINARSLWIKILTTRLETGEPYLFFKDSVNKYLPESYKKLGLNVKTSNLCAEITLSTGLDHLNKERTAVCCLSSLNLEYFEKWEKNEIFIEDIMKFLDNVLSDFIKRASDNMERAKYSAMRERSVGLGVMGFHSFLQGKMISFESVMAKSWNKRIFTHIRSKCDEISCKLASERGACPDMKECGINERFTHKMAVAPTASISNICGETSPGIEPYVANIFTQKTLCGSFVIKDKHLKKLLLEKRKNNSEIWSSIAVNEGSVNHLEFFTPEEKSVFKTAFEINQQWILEHAADRTEFICQSQSLNLFIKSNISKKDLHYLHFQAWKKGIKSLYYCRSRSLQRAEIISDPVLHGQIKINADLDKTKNISQTATLYENMDVIENEDECLSCQ